MSQLLKYYNSNKSTYDEPLEPLDRAEGGFQIKFSDVTNVKNVHCDPNDNSRILITQNFLTGLPQKYFTISNNLLSDSYINCTSFITSIFSNINCQRGIPINPVIPTWCNTSPPTNQSKLQEAFNLFYDKSSGSAIKLVEFLQLNKKRKICADGDTECIISGGKYKKTRKGKNRKGKTRKSHTSRKGNNSKGKKTISLKHR